MSSIRKATLLSLGQRYVAFLIQLGSSIVLARLLSPSETGLYALATAVVALAQLLRDFGIGEYVVQEKNISRAQLRSVLGASFLLAWTIALALLSCAGLLAEFYGEPGVRTVLQLLAVNFLLLPIGTTTFAMLTKEMAFKEIFVVQTVSAAASAGLSILLAWRGHSYMSLAWASVFGTLCTVALLAVLRPGLTFMLPSFSGLRAIGRFGGTVTLGRLFDQLCRRAPDILVAQHLGFHAVGINSKAGSLLDAFHDFFVSGISRVATPAFARDRHEDGDAGQAYLKSMRTLVIFPMVFFMLVGLLSEPIIRLLFGEAWLQAVPLLRIGAIAGLLGAPYFLAPPLLTAHGRVTDLLHIQTVGGVVLLLLIYLGSTQSLVALALAGTVGGCFKLALIHRALARCTGLSMRQLLGSCAPSAMLAGPAGGLAALALWLQDGSASGAFESLCLAGVLAALVLLPGLWCSGHPLGDELRVALRRRGGHA